MRLAHHCCCAADFACTESMRAEAKRSAEACHLQLRLQKIARRSSATISAVSQKDSATTAKRQKEKKGWATIDTDRYLERRDS